MSKVKGLSNILKLNQDIPVNRENLYEKGLQPVADSTQLTSVENILPELILYSAV